MKNLCMTPDTFRRVLQHANEYPLPPAVASPLLDFVHETTRNAEHAEEAALVFVDADEIITCTGRLLDCGSTTDAAVREAFALQFGAGTAPDEQVQQIITAAVDNSGPTTRILQDASELLGRIAHTIYTPEDEAGQ